MVYLPFNASFESILSLITGGNVLNASNVLNTTAFVSNGSAGAMEIPKDVAGLIALVSSSKPLFDYLKFVALGALLEIVRRLLTSVMSLNFYDRFTLTATFQSDDISYGA